MKSVQLLRGIFCCLLLITSDVLGYGLPHLGLGFSSFLDGGPLRPSPGWYWLEYAQYYSTHKFLDAHGQPLGGVRSPKFTFWSLVSELIYQSERVGPLHGSLGATLVVPAVLTSHLESNVLGIRDSGAGVGNLILGLYIQWEAIFYHERPIFVHRLEFNVSLPAGKNREPCFNINPGNDFYFINPYWAATLFLTERWSLAWRLNYVWSAKNPATGIQAGDALFLNYGLAYEVVPKFFIGANGYILGQVRDNTLHGERIPNTREQVVAIGPGAIYAPSKDLYFIADLYFERHARNRPQGINFIMRFIKNF